MIKYVSCFLLIANVFFSPLAFADDRVSVGMSGVDDVGKVFVANKKGVREVASCTWTANPGCSSEADISFDLRIGENIVLFVLWNDVYTGCPAFFPCGKYAGQFWMSKNGRVEWSDSISVNDNSRGVKKIWASIVRIDQNGKAVIVSEDQMSRENREALSDIKDMIRSKF